MALGLPAMGMISCLGGTKAQNAQALFSGKRSGMIARDDLVPGRGVFVGQISDDFPDLPEGLTPWQCRNNQLAFAALQQISSEVDHLIARVGSDRVAVVMGTSTSGISDGEMAFVQRLTTGSWPASFDYRQQEAGGLSRFVAEACGITGPAFTIATACSSSGKVFASARRLIRLGIVDAAIVGGVDSLCQMTLNGFSSLEAMSRGLCSPFSKNRDGINIGEAAVVFILTKQECQVQLLGVGEVSDAYHISAPDPEGKGAILSMSRALNDADLGPEQISYINLHGTGTVLNDSMESRATGALFPSETPCSSTKGLTGHTLGAAGALEAAFLWLILQPEFNPSGFLPPHVWDGVADPELHPLSFVGYQQRFDDDEFDVAMLSNSFAFGGSNVTLILGRRAQ